MSNQHQQWFHLGPWAFNIDAAHRLLADAPRDTHNLDVTTWATAYGLTHLDSPDRTAVNLIGPAPGAVDRLYAMSTDLTAPVILGQLSVNGSPPAALLIDGVHRLYRAWRENLPLLPAYLLTAEETLQIRHHKHLGPGGTHIAPPLI